MSQSPRLKSPVLKTRLSPLLGIFLTVFLDLLSFGLFIPDLQLRGEVLATNLLGRDGRPADPTQVGFLVGAVLGVFSLAQLIASPLLGRWSDRVGRRRILIITTFLSLVSYVVYAHAEHYSVVVASRLLAGLAAANLGVAFAYVADVTEPENRSKGFGMVGAALGVGFILGPPAGGILISLGKDSPLLLGYVGAALVLVNLLYIVLFLPEPEVIPAERKSFLQEVKVAVTTPGLALLLAMFFAFNLGFANLQSTFFLLLSDERSVFHLSDAEAKKYGSYIMGMVGLIGALMQGVIVPRLTPLLGEVNMLRIGFLLIVPSLAFVPFAPLWLPMILVLIVMGTGSGLSQPSLNSLVSRNAPAEIQGGIFGVTQSLGALARLIGPLISGPLFAQKTYLPYLLGGAIVLFPALAAWRVRIPESQPEMTPDPA